MTNLDAAYAVSQRLARKSASNFYFSFLLLPRDKNPLQRLTEREREVLALMAEGRSNTGIARALHVSESAIAKHVNAIFTKLDMPTTAGDHRRVLAVLQYLSE